jgi:prohibitin 2
MGILVVVIILSLICVIALGVAFFSSDGRIPAFITAGVSFALGLIIIITGSSCIIDNGNVAVMVRFQQPTGEILGSGFHWKSLIDTPVSMSIQTQKFEVDCEAASKDLQDVTSKIAINYKLDSNKASEIYKTIGLNYFEVIGHPAIQETVKAVTAQYNAEDMILQREVVKIAISDALKTKLAERGIISEAVNITNFSFSP